MFVYWKAKANERDFDTWRKQQLEMIGQKSPGQAQLITLWQRSRLTGRLFAMHALEEFAVLRWGPGVFLHLANLAQALGRAKPLPFS
jgi:hypothetical protein